jgi:hypothetical protein
MIGGEFNFTPTELAVINNQQKETVWRSQENQAIHNNSKQN